MRTSIVDHLPRPAAESDSALLVNHPLTVDATLALRWLSQPSRGGVLSVTDCAKFAITGALAA